MTKKLGRKMYNTNVQVSLKFYHQECVAKGFEGKPIFKENNEGHQFEENMKKFMPGKTKLKCQGTQYIQVGAILTEVKEIVCFNNSLLPLPNKFLCNGFIVNIETKNQFIKIK